MDTQPVPAGTPPRPSWVIWAGLAVVLAAAAVLSFDGLRGLALTVSIAPGLAWLLPIAVDAGAAVSCATWLGGRTTTDAARYAGRMTMALLAVTVLGNAGHLGMQAEDIVPPWYVAVIVGAIPPAVVGTTVHLVVLLIRAAGPGVVPIMGPAQTTGPVIQTAEQTTALPAVVQLTQDDVDEHSDDDLIPVVRQWIAQQDSPPSQRQLRTHFGIGAERARRLMEAAA